MGCWGIQLERISPEFILLHQEHFISKIEPTVFDHKNTTARRDMTMSVRAIRGWQDPSQIKVPNPNHKCRRLPVDDEMCECGDVTDVGEEPDYDIETLKLVATIAVVAEKATARKAKRSKRAAIAKVDGPAAKKVCTEGDRSPCATVHAVGVWAKRGLCT